MLDSGLVPCGTSNAGFGCSEDGRELFTTIVAFIKRFCFIAHDCIYELLALWVLLTYVYPEFQYVPYLFITSPEKQSGKTRLLEVLNLLVFNSSGILCSPTEAVLFRTAKDKTQLLDEADGWQNFNSIRSVLNAGFQKNGKVTRMEKDANGTYRPMDFPVFGPKAIAGIGKRILGDTLFDRVFAIELVRQTDSEQRDKLRPGRIQNEVNALKSRMQQWADHNRSHLQERYDSQTDYPYLSGFRDRTEDISEPLAVILELVYENDPSARGRATTILSAAIAKTRCEEHGNGDEHTFLAILLRNMHDAELQVQPIQIAGWCKSELPEIDEYRAGEILRKYSLDNRRSARVNGLPRKCYCIRRERVEELVKRYCPSPTM